MSRVQPVQARTSSTDPELHVTLPAVESPPGYDAARDQFLRATRPAGDAVRRNAGGSTNALALFAGSRVSAFRELDVDGMVMLDWSRPGTDAQIMKAFAAPRELKRSVRDGIAAGNSSSDVIAAPVGAEIIMKLGLDLGINEVRVGRFTLPGKPVAFESGILAPNDAPSVMVFDFVHQGRPRRIAFVSWRLHGEGGPGASPTLPEGLLRLMMPRGYSWVYCSADGLALFSREPQNGLQQTSRQLVRDLAPGGAVIAEDARGSAYLNGGQDGDGISFMRGRAPLASYGLVDSAAITVTRPVYGYAGSSPADSVRIAVKPGRPAPGTEPAPIATDGLVSQGWTRYVIDRR